MGILLLTRLATVFSSNFLSEEVIIVPSIRMLTEKEKDFAEGKWKKSDFEILESIKFPSGTAFISLEENSRKELERRKRILGSLSGKVGPDGSIDVNKMDAKDKEDACQLLFKLNPRSTKNFPPTSLETTQRFQFSFEGTRFNVELANKRADKPLASLPTLEDLIEMPKNIKAVQYDPKVVAPADPPQGIQIVFKRNSWNRLERATILGQVMKAYQEYEVAEFAKMTELLDKLFYNLNYDSPQTNLNGKSVPAKALDSLARQLREKYPERFASVQEARDAVKDASLIGSRLDVNLVLQFRMSGTQAYYRYNLARRPMNP
jgi:hypothetical protein